MAELLDIAEVARRSGLAPSALRFYERKGLIEADARNGLRRAYRPEVLGRLARIRAARTAGFTLARIREILSDQPADAALRRLLADHAREVDDQIKRLIAIRDGLQHAVTCRHQPLSECPYFLVESPCS
ncbi:MerR family transcriptional regulator [Amycolatopsis taiwanensis]|uniref:MerR family transcriptional regulator n=1 Tax=Amycolatopsis taiwanensis TaxID=342230 RepID=A0A9W6QZU9_9PSEU|nr:MerR family transcriptional regulator [Amycolatopsis taiwanensis]GLY65072.1 MerR family transcriptional regulator [Amycolatopsis taiwanensis]